MSRTYLSKLKRKIKLSLIRLKDNLAYQKKLIKKKIKSEISKAFKFAQKSKFQKKKLLKKQICFLLSEQIIWFSYINGKIIKKYFLYVLW